MRVQDKNDIWAMIDKIRDTIYGNGKEGIISRLSKLEAKQKLILTLQLAILGAILAKWWI